MYMCVCVCVCVCVCLCVCSVLVCLLCLIQKWIAELIYLLICLPLLIANINLWDTEFCRIIIQISI